MQTYDLPNGYKLHRTEKTITITDKNGERVQSRLDVKHFVESMNYVAEPTPSEEK